MDLWDIIGPMLLIGIVVGGVGAYASQKIPDLVGYINILVLYIPISLLFAGFIPDIISQSFKYSVISISGLISVLLNRIASSLAISYLGEQHH
jgi:branched-subunit amino acid transport protein